jgi:hypothetical protein
MITVRSAEDSSTGRMFLQRAHRSNTAPADALNLALQTLLRDTSINRI